MKKWVIMILAVLLMALMCISASAEGIAGVPEDRICENLGSEVSAEVAKEAGELSVTMDAESTAWENYLR